MDPNSVKFEAARPLEELLAEERYWPPAARLRLIRRVAEQVGSLHGEGRVHRRVEAAEITIDEQFRPRLSEPGEGRCFGGECSDPEYCPAELAPSDAADPAQRFSLELPADIAAAAAVLRGHGRDFDPRLIDIYQLGTLACRLLTGGSIREYTFTLDARERLSPSLTSLLDRTLGHCGEDRIRSIDELVESLADAKIQDYVKESDKYISQAKDTPPQGSIIGREGDTPPLGLPAQKDAEIPCERLGQYRIIKPIGRGGMGDVYLAEDETLQRRVAVKVLPRMMCRDEHFIRRFRAEAAAAAKISHPNVVQIYSVSNEHDGRPFFAMQYIDGCTLAERLARQRRLPTAEAVDIVEQCLAGLGAAHRAGLIHRDVKPGNILIERESGRAVLVDFGLVRRLDGSTQLTATGMVMGTVDYIAPEQARGKNVDARADIYALGVLLYQMLSGRLPFEAETLVAMIFQHAYEEPLPLEEAAPGLPLGVKQIVARMMAKDPEERYQSCEEVLADVAAFNEGRPLDAGSWKDTSIVLEECAAGDPELSREIEAILSPRRLRQAREFVATMFRRHAPEFVKNLQSTTQQFDGAVAAYERRRNRLQKLLDDGRGIEVELAAQIEANLSAATAALTEAEAADNEEAEAAAISKKRDCDECVAALRGRAEEQRRQIEELELQTAKAETALARLCSQRDLLKARLRTAEARQQIEGGGIKTSFRRPAILLAACLALITAGIVLLFVARPRPEISPPQNEIAAPTAPLPATPGELRPRLNPNLPPSPALAMTFEKNTFIERLGSVEKVRNMAGPFNAGDGLNLVSTTEGKVGGALICNNGHLRIPQALRNMATQYTFTAWIKKQKDRPFTFLADYDHVGDIIGQASASAGGGLGVTGFNINNQHHKYGNWITPVSFSGNLIAPNEWTFVALRLSDGAAGKGNLRITINEHSKELPFQMIKSRRGRGGYTQLGQGNDEGGGEIDEVTFYDRALSDSEIEAIYKIGRDGDNLGELVAGKELDSDERR